MQHLSELNALFHLDAADRLKMAPGDSKLEWDPKWVEDMAQPAADLTDYHTDGEMVSAPRATAGPRRRPCLAVVCGGQALTVPRNGLSTRRLTSGTRVTPRPSSSPRSCGGARCPTW